MTKSMFLDIATVVEAHDAYFIRKANAVGTWGFSHLQKVIAALQMLTYGGPADLFDEYIRMGESTMLESIRHFVRSVVAIYGPQYLRSPTAEDLDMLLQKAESRGFLGMLGSIDYMHWEWEKCLVAWQGRFRGTTKNLQSYRRMLLALICGSRMGSLASPDPLMT
jgi:hypothetical protein